MNLGLWEQHWVRVWRLFLSTACAPAQVVLYKTNQKKRPELAWGGGKHTTAGEIAPSTIQSLVLHTPSHASFSFLRNAKNSGLKYFCDRLFTGEGREWIVPSARRWNWCGFGLVPLERKWATWQEGTSFRTYLRPRLPSNRPNSTSRKLLHIDQRHHRTESDSGDIQWE